MEIRGVWITSTASRVLNSKQNLAEAMNFLAQTGFNVVLPVVWNNGYTFYPSQVMRQLIGVEIAPAFQGRDPLAELVVEAKRVGLAVIPWFEYGFSSSFSKNGGQLLEKKPEWAGRDSAGNLLKKNGFEWLNALDPEVQDFILSLILEVVRNYDIVGIQGDDRMPAMPSEGGYDPKTVARYRQLFNTDPPQNSKDPQWLQWRADILTDFLTRLYREVIAIKPNLIISMSPSHYPWGLQEYLQDTQAWISQGLVDLIHPQLYRRDLDGYKQLVDAVVTQQFSAQQLPQLAPGVLVKSGTYRVSADDLLQSIAYNRTRGIQGEVFFFYEGLREDNDALAKALQAGPYAQPRPFNVTQVKGYGFTNRRIGSQYRYINSAGKSVIQPQFDWVYSFTEGLARVRMGYKWGFIDTTGKLVSRLQFDHAEPFAEGLALVKIGNIYGFIDKTGKLIIQLQVDQADSFSGGFARVKTAGKWGYISKLGTLVIPTQFDEAASFSEGLAPVKLGQKWGYIAQSGTLTIPAQYDSADAFSQTLAAVRIGNKWGYVNKTGQLSISAQFDSAESFSEGLAAVKMGTKWGYINTAGKVVISPEFDAAKPFSEGMALINIGGEWLQSVETGEAYIRGGKWGYIRNVLK